jgi:hypothetical protein
MAATELTEEERFWDCRNHSFLFWVVDKVSNVAQESPASLE